MSADIKRISTKEALAIHEMLTKRTGGSAGLCDAALLDSALQSPFQTFGGTELYPTLAEKGARLGFSLIANHAFLDGNKRIGVLLLLTFLSLNGMTLSFTDDDVIRVGLGVASGKISYEGLLALIRTHCTPNMA